MAELALGAVAAEQAVSTTIEGGAVAGYAVAQPTLPLKATFKRIGVATGADNDFLNRSHHTLTHHKSHLYLFGGVTPQGIATNETHIFSLGSSPPYRVIPAIAAPSQLLEPSSTAGPTNPDPAADAQTPAPRAGHSAVIIDDEIAVFGGFSDAATREPLQEAGRIHLLDVSAQSWSQITPVSTTFPALHSHNASVWRRNIIVHGGIGPDGPSDTTWIFSLATRTWTPLDAKAPPSTASPSNFTIVNDTAYLLTWPDALSSTLHALDLSSQSHSWTQTAIPTNPLVPGPRSRHGAGLVPISTGMGRAYLLLLLGAKEEHSTDNTTQHEEFYSGVWALQLPSQPNSAAQVKDAVRESVGASTHGLEWSEVGVRAIEQTALTGKAHPGPRGYFGYTVVDGAQVALWGGEDATGAAVADGWIVDVKGPTPVSLFGKKDQD